MPTAVYPFTRFQYADGSIDKRGYARVPVRITNGENGLSAETWALIDTGADATLFPSKLASDLGHKLKGLGVRTSVTGGIEQTPITAYAHTFRVELLSADRTRVLWSLRDREIDCVETDPPILLGVEDFLCHFRLTIDYPREEIRMKW